MRHTVFAILMMAGCGSGVSGGANDLAMKPGDSSTVVDLAAHEDQAPPPDLSMPDLAMPPDLSKPPDLAKPPDLTQMGGGCLNGTPCPPMTVCCMQGIRAGQCYNPACLACCM